MICDRCQRPMQFATDAGNWWCSHCHRRIRPTSAGLAAPRGPRSAASNTTLPAAHVAPLAAAAPVAGPPPTAGPSAPAMQSEGARVRQHVAPGASQPVILVRPPVWPAVVAGVLAMIGVGMVAAVLVRCESSSSSGGPSRGLIERMLPKQALSARGMSFAELRSTDIGRQMLRDMSIGYLDDLVDRECNTSIGDVVAWTVRTDDSVNSMGNGLSAARLAWTEDQITDCLTKMARSSGGILEVKRQDQLRAYVVRERNDVEFNEESFHAAFLESDLALVVGDIRADRQRRVLEATLARKEPERGNEDLRRALGLVDMSATFWMALRRPSRDDFPEDFPDDEPRLDADFDDLDLNLNEDGDFGEPASIERWYDEDISGLLGARPDAVYWSVDVGSRLIVRGGAVYKSERKAERVAAHLKEKLAAGLGTSMPDLNRVDPALREALAKRLREGFERAQSLRGTVLGALRVEVDGDVVRLEASVSWDALGDGEIGARLLEELNRLLPRKLAVKL